MMMENSKQNSALRDSISKSLWQETAGVVENKSTAVVNETCGRITEFVKENADVAWHFIADRFSSSNLKALTDLKSGEGKLVDYEGKKLAIYKDDAGKVTALNPTCTHAGCTVQFNAAEQSWDYPCHGGRFDVSGKMLTGPPTIDLEAVIISYDQQP